MDKLHYIFREIDSNESISNLAEILNTNSVNGLIQIPPSHGIGRIKKVQLDRGIVLRIWNFNLNKPITFSKQAHRYTPDEKY